MEQFISIAERFGLPVVMLLGMSYGMIQLFKWLTNDLMKQIAENHSRIEAIIIKLIDNSKQERADNKLYFEWKGPLPKKEELYYTESAESKDFEILKELLVLRDSEGEVKTIQVEGVLADYDMSRATVYRWIQKQIGFGTLKKSGHGSYKIAENDLWNLLS